jgi:nitrite reductase/ring-hydroxylating ferredoxin subunit
MSITAVPSTAQKRGAEDAGRYFRYMADFVGFTQAHADTIRETALIIEKYIPDVVSKFYAHLLRYPPTRKYFLKQDGSIDQDYLQLRMHHLTNFWRRTAGGVYDDDYARYVDYVGRAHTSQGADPHLYIPERYVIGQVGFMQHAISEAIVKDLYATQEACTHANGPLSEGDLEGTIVTCPWHASCFDVANGAVVCGPATEALRTHRVVVDGEVVRIEEG